MPTLNDAINEVEQVNDNLSDIKGSLANLNTRTETTNERIEANTEMVEEVRDACIENTQQLSQINARLLTGFAKLSEGLDVLIDQAEYNNKATEHHLQQTDTIICLLDKSARSLCEIWTLVAIQTKALKAIQEDTGTVRAILETVHPDAYLELERHRELQRDIERCCPPKKDPPAREFEPCLTPRRFDEEIPPAEYDPLPLPTPEG